MAQQGRAVGNGQVAIAYNPSSRFDGPVALVTELGPPVLVEAFVVRSVCEHLSGASRLAPHVVTRVVDIGTEQVAFADPHHVGRLGHPGRV